MIPTRIFKQSEIKIISIEESDKIFSEYPESFESYVSEDIESATRWNYMYDKANDILYAIGETSEYRI